MGPGTCSQRVVWRSKVLMVCACWYVLAPRTNAGQAIGSVTWSHKEQRTAQRVALVDVGLRHGARHQVARHARCVALGQRSQRLVGVLGRQSVREPAQAIISICTAGVWWTVLPLAEDHAPVR